LDPRSNATGGLSVAIQPDVEGGSLLLDGATMAGATSALGQQARFNFSIASASQAVGLGMSNLVQAPLAPAGSAGLIVRRLDGTQVGGCSPSETGAGCALRLTNLVAGNYTIVVQPKNSTTNSSFELTLSSDATGALALDTPYALTVSRRGQGARLSFSANAGENRRLTATGVSTSPPVGANTVAVGWSLLRSTGAPVSTGSFLPGNPAPANIANLPATDTYTLVFTQNVGLEFAATLRLTQY
jgi:hypothetical protein